MKPKCQCKDGFVRDRGQCIRRKMCPRTVSLTKTAQSYVDEPILPSILPIPTCATTLMLCKDGTHCQDLDGGPQCVDDMEGVPARPAVDPIPTCAGTPTLCKQGALCVDVDGRPQCVNNHGA
ncbi:unnamed protein product [Heligmosomoides polygyrus]|uniref:EB domain-containing protein n=1 Tax=Heligmosomoides polygyrus TaxID=6339 RepID=A0A183GPP5_HELPZ|nr:unnamed protein product [Heligmosomoides polygyrus]